MKYEEGIWQREGRFIYVLMRDGYRCGKEQFKNKAWAQFDFDKSVSTEEREQIVSIFIAAPDMLAALKRMVVNVDKWNETGEPAGPEESESIYDQMVAAIRKAEGK